MIELKATIAVISDEPNHNSVIVKYDSPSTAFLELIGKDLAEDFHCVDIELVGNEIIGHFWGSSDYIGFYPFVGHRAESVTEGVYQYTGGSGKFIEPYFVETHSDIGAKPLEVIR